MKCPRCNISNRIRKKGFNIFAKPPHRRQQFQCTQCGHVWSYIGTKTAEVTD